MTHSTPTLFRELAWFRIHLPVLLAILALAAMDTVPAQQANPAPAGEMVEIGFPGNPVSEVLSLYELLSGKRLVRDSNLAGPNLTVIVPGKVSKADAIALLESALLLNGYTLVPVDESTVKVLGAAKSPLGEGVPLYADPASLPQGEQVVSYFMLLKYISTKDAMAVFEKYVTPRAGGSIVPVPNSNAILISDNTPLIRRLISLQRFLDVPGAKVLTEFVSLTRADAEKVVDVVNKLLEQEKKDDAQGSGNVTIESTPPPNGANGANGAQVPAPAPAGLTSATTFVQVVADVRTNRVLVVAAESRMAYIRSLIQELDMAVALEQPLERPLKFVSAGDVLPVLQSLLAEGSSTENGANGANSGNAAPPPSQQQVQDDFVSSGGTSPSGGGTGKPDKLTAPRESVAPLAVSVGKVRIIADRSSNKIIVIGPPESRNKAARVLDMLDQRPKQVYLATVIGQLTLGKDTNLGIGYPGSITGKLYVAGSNGNGAVVTTGSGTTSNGTINNGLVNNSGVDLLPGTGQLVNSAINLAAGSLSGLSIYGVIADSIDVTLNAFQSSNRFKVISRPVIYTANNKKAVISSGQQVPVPENTLTSSLAVGNQGTSVASNIGYKDVVLKLEVIPLINSKDEVTLTIAQQNDNVLETVTISDNQVPVVGTQELTTTVTVPNKHTVVIGGLITEQEEDGRTGLPYLSEIPGLQYIFGTKTKNKVRRELIILIQPHIVDNPIAQWEGDYNEKNLSSMAGEFYEGAVPVRPALPVTPGKSAPANWEQSSGRPGR